MRKPGKERVDPGRPPSHLSRLLITPHLPHSLSHSPDYMPVPAPSQLPPFLSSAVQSKDGSEGNSFLSSASTTVPSPSTANNASTSKEGIEGANASTTQRLINSDWTLPNEPTAFHSSASSLLVPPLNFDMVSSGGGSGAIYRSGHPNERNFQFMSTLNLKTIIYLSSDDVRDNLQGWIDATHGAVKLLHFRLKVNKEPFAEMDQAIVAEALAAILDRRNLPALIHCNKGKYRVGVVTALIRRLQGWSITSIYDEYARFAGSDRVADEEVRQRDNDKEGQGRAGRRCTLLIIISPSLPTPVHRHVSPLSGQAQHPLYPRLAEPEHDTQLKRIHSKCFFAL